MAARVSPWVTPVRGPAPDRAIPCQGERRCGVRADAALTSPHQVVRRAVRVRGVVQGVGFRPFVYSLAGELGLSGEVRNDTEGVLAQVQGAARDVEAFCARVAADAPALAVVEDVSWAALDVVAQTGFVITASRSGGGRTLVPADVATCAGMPGRADRPRRPALPASVHHLHGLRPALHHRHRPALRPADDDDGRLPDVPALRRRVRRPRRPALPRPAGRLPRLRSAARADRTGGTRNWRGRRRWPGPARCSPPAPWSRSRASAATTSPVTRPTPPPCAGCASASVGAASPSRCWCPTWRPRARWRWWASRRPNCSPARGPRSCCCVAARPRAPRARWWPRRSPRATPTSA